MNKVRYYTSFEDDFIESKNQQYRLPTDYKYIRSRFLSALIYGIALVFSNIYCRIFLHVKFKNHKILRKYKEYGIFLYGNHTQPVGDVFDPALACFPKRIYTVVSPANLGIPFLGKVLPFLGALPISDTVSGIKRLNQAIKRRLDERCCIVIYPEAHVWEYCTEIRPFADTSFKFPVKFGAPAFCMTATYQRRRFAKKPAITIYIDGPFNCSADLGPKAQAAELRDKVYECMKKRSQKSNYSYIEYKKQAI